MSGSEWIGLAAVVVFALLVLLLVAPLRKLGRYLDEATAALRRQREHPVPAAAPAQTLPAPSAGRTELPIVAVPEPFEVPTADAAPLSTVVAATLGGPLIKVASLGYGVRTAARTRQESRARAAAGRRGRDARRTTRRAA